MPGWRPPRPARRPSKTLCTTSTRRSTTPMCRGLMICCDCSTSGPSSIAQKDRRCGRAWYHDCAGTDVRCATARPLGRDRPGPRPGDSRGAAPVRSSPAPPTTPDRVHRCGPSRSAAPRRRHPGASRVDPRPPHDQHGLRVIHVTRLGPGSSGGRLRIDVSGNTWRIAEVVADGLRLQGQRSHDRSAGGHVRNSAGPIGRPCDDG